MTTCVVPDCFRGPAAGRQENRLRGRPPTTPPLAPPLSAGSDPGEGGDGHRKSALRAIRSVIKNNIYKQKGSLVRFGHIVSSSVYPSGGRQTSPHALPGFQMSQLTKMGAKHNRCRLQHHYTSHLATTYDHGPFTFPAQPCCPPKAMFSSCHCPPSQRRPGELSACLAAARPSPLCLPVSRPRPLQQSGPLWFAL